MQHLKSFSTIWIWWKLLLETDYQITIETPFYKFTSVEYQCKLSVMSILISAFSTGITQRIVVKSKKNCKAYKKEGEKEKDYILKLVTFLHLQVITPCQKVNRYFVPDTRDDICWVPAKNLICEVNLPEASTTRQFYVFKEVNF